LYNREAFALYGFKGGYSSIYYLNPSGVFKTGLLKDPPIGEKLLGDEEWHIELT
jgi:hypothetical protein